MALSAKERQQRYREKRKSERGYRLDMIVSSVTDAHLDALSLHGNMTKKQLIEKLVKDEFVRLVNTDETFNQLIYRQSAESLAEPLPNFDDGKVSKDTPNLPPSEPSQLAEADPVTKTPPKPKKPAKRTKKAVAVEKPAPDFTEPMRCEKTLDMFDNDWRTHGLNDIQIDKIKSEIYIFGDNNLDQFTKFMQNGENYMLAFKHIEPLLKDPKTASLFNIIDEILAKP